MYLLDTNHCGLILQGRPDVAARFRRVDSARIATSVIVAGELVFMAARSDERRGNLVLVRDFVRSIHVFGVDASTAEIDGDVKAALLDRLGPRARAERRRFDIGKLGITDNDLWIAATAKQHGLQIVSSDRDFRRIGPVAGIDVESWWVPAPAPPPS